MILAAGDPVLINPNHVITVNPTRFARVNARGAELFARFLVSQVAQPVIASFGVDRYGESLCRPALVPTVTSQP